ncbi:MAG: acetamidase/formamidase family protein [Thermoanaerobaculia bacterium]
MFKKAMILTGVAVTLSGCEAPPPADPPAAVEPAAAVEVDFRLGSEQTHNKFSRSIPPNLRVPSGSVVELWTKEATDGQLDVGSTVADVPDIAFDPVHPLTGPIYVEGAEPGDLLVVTLHDIAVGDWGWGGIVPGFGWLADEHDRAYLKTFEIGAAATEVRFAEGITLPVAPFPGVMGVAPDTDELLSTIPPRANGGNMDNKYLTVGTRVYFPVFVEGALFSIGDTHALQGDGEVCGTAVEAPMRIVLELEVVKGARRLPEPQYETDGYYAVTAFAETLDEAARKATRYMIDYLVEERGLTRDDAYVLCSLAGDLKISEVVDVPHVLVSMHMPKAIFTG